MFHKASKKVAPFYGPRSYVAACMVVSAPNVHFCLKKFTV